jgi:DUF2075 family protein
MRLYAGSAEQFLQDTLRNQIAEKLKNAFFHYFRYEPSKAEQRSWQNSLRSISGVVDSSNLHHCSVLIEYQLPITSKRLDFLICGKDEENNDNAVIVELKQWEDCEPSGSENEVQTYVGGNVRDVLHPSVQVHQYRTYLEDTHTAFYGENAVSVAACSYLHNYHTSKIGDELFAEKFKDKLNQAPIFTADDFDNLSNYLIDQVDNGDDGNILKKIEESEYRPSKKLMQHVSGVIKNEPRYVLLDEQLVVYDKVFERAKNFVHVRHKSVIIIKGGPGSGKSVIAINLMADLLAKNYNAHYSTGSKAFTETLRKAVGPRGSVQFKYFNSYSQAHYNDIDVLICDESHRIRKTSNSRFTKKENRSGKAQIQEIIDASKVSVFFIDDDQIVRPDEIGSVDYIKSYAEENDCEVNEFELETQFRCAGSESFINWINNTLNVKKTPNIIWNSSDEEFDFQIFDSPFKLEQAIHEKLEEGYSARMTAGFCWPWSDPNPDGSLPPDVKIGDFQRPWNAKPNATGLAKGIPKSYLWAYDPNGIDQIGCIYTAQGFEFDYVGVIVGKDLYYNFNMGQWEGFKEYSADNVVKRSKDQFLDLIKNTYRVLLSRGMKGCYVFFEDKETEKFFRSRVE